jgi:hypothetical protein
MDSINSVRVIKGLNRIGLTLGTMRVIAMPGRKSGKLRATPVSPLTVAGCRYVRRTEKITLTEVTDPEEQRAVLRAFPTEVPQRVDLFVQAGVVAGRTPDDSERGAGRCVIFLITSRR